MSIKLTSSGHELEDSVHAVGSSKLLVHNSSRKWEVDAISNVLIGNKVS